MTADELAYLRQSNAALQAEASTRSRELARLRIQVRELSRDVSRFAARDRLVRSLYRERAALHERIDVLTRQRAQATGGLIGYKIELVDGVITIEHENADGTRCLLGQSQLGFNLYDVVTAVMFHRHERAALP